MGPHHPGAPVPDRQAQPPGPGRGLRWLHRCWPPFEGIVVALGARRRAGHVAAADPRPGRLGGGPGPPGAVRVQHPGRVPRRGRRAGPAHRPAGHRRRPLARAGRATAGPTPSPCCPTTWPTTSGPRSPGAWPAAAAGARRPRCGSSPTSSTPTGSRPGPAENAYRAEYGLHRQAGGDVRRQRRPVAVARPGARRRRRPAPRARRGLRDQRRGSGPARARAAGPGARQPPLRRHAAQGPPARGAGGRRRPRGAAQAGPGLVERAVEALLDPGRRAAPRGQRRPGHRGGAHRRAGRRRPGRAARRPRGVHQGDPPPARRPRRRRGHGSGRAGASSSRGPRRPRSALGLRGAVRRAPRSAAHGGAS